MLRLCFGACDYETEVYVNGKMAGVHKGGCTSFSMEIFSRVCDYTKTTGIWQTVWMECVEPVYVEFLEITPHAAEGTSFPESGI